MKKIHCKDMEEGKYYLFILRTAKIDTPIRKRGLVLLKLRSKSSYYFNFVWGMRVNRNGELIEEDFDFRNRFVDVIEYNNLLYYTTRDIFELNDEEVKIEYLFNGI